MNTGCWAGQPVGVRVSQPCTDVCGLKRTGSVPSHFPIAGIYSCVSLMVNLTLASSPLDIDAQFYHYASNVFAAIWIPIF